MLKAIPIEEDGIEEDGIDEPEEINYEEVRRAIPVDEEEVSEGFEGDIDESIEIE